MSTDGPLHEGTDGPIHLGTASPTYLGTDGPKLQQTSQLTKQLWNTRIYQKYKFMNVKSGLNIGIKNVSCNHGNEIHIRFPVQTKTRVSSS